MCHDIVSCASVSSVECGVSSGVCHVSCVVCRMSYHVSSFFCHLMSVESHVFSVVSCAVSCVMTLCHRSWAMCRVLCRVSSVVCHTILCHAGAMNHNNYPFKIIALIKHDFFRKTGRVVFVIPGRKAVHEADEFISWLIKHENNTKCRRGKLGRGGGVEKARV